MKHDESTPPQTRCIPANLPQEYINHYQPLSTISNPPKSLKLCNPGCSDFFSHFTMEKKFTVSFFARGLEGFDQPRFVLPDEVVSISLSESSLKDLGCLPHLAARILPLKEYPSAPFFSSSNLVLVISKTRKR